MSTCLMFMYTEREEIRVNSSTEFTRISSDMENHPTYVRDTSAQILSVLKKAKIEGVSLSDYSLLAIITTISRIGAHRSLILLTNLYMSLVFLILVRILRNRKLRAQWMEKMKKPFLVAVAILELNNPLKHYKYDLVQQLPTPMVLVKSQRDSSQLAMVNPPRVLEMLKAKCSERRENEGKFWYEDIPFFCMGAVFFGRGVKRMTHVNTDSFQTAWASVECGYGSYLMARGFLGPKYQLSPKAVWLTSATIGFAGFGFDQIQSFETLLNTKEKYIESLQKCNNNKPVPVAQATDCTAEYKKSTAQGNTCVAEYNKFATDHNSLVHDHKNLVDEHNSLVEEHHSLIDVHNSLVDEHKTMYDGCKKSVAEGNECKEAYNSLVVKYRDLASRKNHLMDDYEKSVAQGNECVEAHNSLLEDYNLRSKMATLYRTSLTEVYKDFQENFTPDQKKKIMDVLSLDVINIDALNNLEQD